MNSTCPFCNGNITTSAFLDCPRFRAIYNIAPILAGHSLVIPKRHVQSVMELADDEVAELFIFCRLVSTLLQKAYGHKAFDWTLQDGEPAGQTVQHLHIHIIPRQFGDLPNPGDWYPKLMGVRESEIIDSGERATLSPARLNRAVENLRNIAKNEQ